MPQMNVDDDYDDGDFSDDLDDVLNVPLTDDDDYQILSHSRGFGNEATDSDDDNEGDFDFTVQDDYSDEEDEDPLSGNPGFLDRSGGSGHRKSKRARREKHSNHKSSWIDDDL